MSSVQYEVKYFFILKTHRKSCKEEQIGQKLQLEKVAILYSTVCTYCIVNILRRAKLHIAYVPTYFGECMQNPI